MTGGAPAGAFVRFAWPHLAKTPKDYDLKMNQLFVALLDGISGGLGEYHPRKGEGLRRPEQ